MPVFDKIFFFLSKIAIEGVSRPIWPLPIDLPIQNFKFGLTIFLPHGVAIFWQFFAIQPIFDNKVFWQKIATEIANRLIEPWPIDRSICRFRILKFDWNFFCHIGWQFFGYFDIAEFFVKNFFLSQNCHRVCRSTKWTVADRSANSEFQFSVKILFAI